MTTAIIIALVITHATAISAGFFIGAVWVGMFRGQEEEITMGRVTESVYSSTSITVPLADVQHVEKHNPHGLIIVTKHTRWDSATGGWANNLWIDKTEATDFMRAWCRYRAELEAGTIADLAPNADERIHADSRFGVGA